jgi:signal transduction histidine kinase
MGIILRIQKKETQAQAARTVYETYWDSYTNGDLETFANTLDDTFEMIGTSESEVCHTKAEGIAFYKAQMQEVVGKVEMRNRQIDVIPVDSLMLVNEICAIYVRADSAWNFYSTIRISTFLRETKDGWKVIQQHGSLPDMRVQEGETLAIEKISRKNLELRDAVRRRTAELDDKNRELAIEAALERVRSKTMSMHASQDVDLAVITLFDELLKLGVDKSVRSGIGILNQSRIMEVWTGSANSSGQTSLDKGQLDMGIHPLLTEAQDSWEAKKTSHSYELEGEDLIRYFKAVNDAPGYSFKVDFDSLPDKIFHYDFFFPDGFLFAFSPNPFSNETSNIFNRFASVFAQTYRRFLDLQNAEANAREAQIEAALERVRAQTMAMHSSEDVGKCIVKMFAELTALGVDEGTRFGIGILNHDNENNQLWTAKKDGEEVKMHIGNLDMASHPLLKSAREAWKAQVPLHKYVLEEEDLLNYYRMLNSAPDYKIQISIEKLPKRELHYGFIFEYGFFYAFSPQEFQPGLIHLTKRFSWLFEQTYRRYLDLVKAEAQAREAQIEAALERVRSRTMAMQRSEELLDVASILFQQVKALGVPQWNCGFNIWEIGDQEFTYYPGTPDGIISPSPCRIPLTEHPVFQRFDESRRKGEELLIFEKEGEMQRGHYQYMLSLPGVGDLLRSMLNAGFEFPKFQIDHVANFAFGNLIFITYEHFPEMHDAFKRFAKVFEQTYTRFLDLQKAEAQTREAKIEAALEKIRSRTMGMQSSEELPEVANLLFLEVQALGIPAWSCGYNILSEDKTSSACIMSSEGTLQRPFPLPLTGEASFIEWYHFLQSQEGFFTQELGGKAIDEHYHYMTSLPELEPIFKDIEAAGLTLPTYQINHLCKFTSGFLLFITYENVPESHDIFRRFTTVFDQTYTRFLDLQKAEAQARESEIEVALEKVRSRSLAMHKSDDLKDVVFSVFERFRELQIQTDSTNIVVYYDESEKMEFWTANEMNYSMKFSLPMTGRFYPEEGIEARKEQKAFYQHLTCEEKNRFWEELFNTTDFRKVPDDRKKFLLEKTECLIQLVAFGKVTGIMLNRYYNIPFSIAEIEITERFAKVFDQAYTRFLDLQKAEAQAREAQIANALEKVRSRSLAMQSPDELVEVAQLLREEMGTLGVEELETTSIYIHHDHDGTTQCWFNIKNSANPGKAITDQMTLDLQATWVGRKMAEFYRSKAKQTSILMQGEQRTEWIRYCEEKSDLFGTSIFYGETIPDRTYHLYKFPNGYIGAAAPGEISKESWDLLKRATAVFSFAYTRFRDLQIAEASARASMRQASLDRVRADISSMRNADDLGRITPLIFHELTTLGIPFIRCGVFIVHDKANNVEIYLSTPEGKSLAAMTLPFGANEMTIRSVEAWKKREVYIQHWNQTDFINWGKSMQEQGYVKDLKTYQGSEYAPESLHLHFVPFDQGLLYVGSTIRLSEEPIDLVKALAKSFAIAYARYEDFVKLEKAKAEVESAMSELKATQYQLVQQEKLASLGQLTAGIAHEIKNPLNFVNNFSEVSIELIDEAIEERRKSQDLPAVQAGRDDSLVDEILEDIKANLKKIHEHGTRANGIVTSMLQHSRGGSGKLDPTDLNALVKEYVSLSFHGMRAGKNPFEVEIDFNLEPAIANVPVIKEDFIRVIINLCNNAFDAMRGKKYEIQRTRYQVEKGNGNDYLPKLAVSTTLENGQVRISLADNGPGIPDEIKDKILQPFFTTKKGTEGTGLGLSITNDIIKAHGGYLSIASDANGSIFTITIPTNS